MLKKTIALAFITAIYCFVNLYAHCQVPCGIYDDEARFTMIKEDIATIEKSINETGKLRKEKDPDNNQIVRWVITKEKHADNIINISADYFLAQRVKITDKEDEHNYELYTKQLELIHRIIISAMKTKQSLDMKNAGVLRKLVDEFEKIYFHVKEEHK